jgi:hypothetical protein
LSLKIYSDNVLRLKDLVFNKKKIDYDCRVLYTLVFVLKIPFIFFFNTHVIPKKPLLDYLIFHEYWMKIKYFFLQFFYETFTWSYHIFFSHLQNIEMFFFNLRSFFYYKNNTYNKNKRVFDETIKRYVSKKKVLQISIFIII